MGYLNIENGYLNLEPEQLQLTIMKKIALPECTAVDLNHLKTKWTSFEGHA